MKLKMIYLYLVVSIMVCGCQNNRCKLNDKGLINFPQGYLRIAPSVDYYKVFYSLRRDYDFSQPYAQNYKDDRVEQNFIQYKTPAGKEVTFDILKEPGHFTIIKIHAAADSEYTTEDISFELARRLELLPDRAKQMVKIQKKDKQI